MIILGSFMIYPYIDTYLGNLAFAHSLPVTQFPAPDSIIKKGEPLPSKVIIDFSERPNPTVSTITILNEKNERVDNGDFTIIGNHSREAMITLNTKKLIDGVYTVSLITQSLMMDILLKVPMCLELAMLVPMLQCHQLERILNNRYTKSLLIWMD